MRSTLPPLVVAALMSAFGIASAAPALAAGKHLETSPLDRLLPQVGPDGGPSTIPDASAVAQYDEFTERMRIRSLVDNLFVVGDAADLAQLEATLDGYRESGELTRAGFSRLNVAYEYFDRSINRTGPTDRYALGIVAKWLQLHPQSVSARVARGILLRNTAHSAFTNMNPGASNEAQDPLKLVDAALDQLYADRSIAEVDPNWHQLVMELEAERGASVAKILELLDAAARVFPKNTDIYKAAARAVAAVSSEPARDIEAVGVLAVARGGSDENYARLYLHISYHLGGVQAARELAIDWARMRTGIAEIVDRYPEQWNIQHFAALTCGVGDAATTLSLMAKVRGRPSRQAWGQLEYFDKCKEWATAASPAPGSKTEKAVDQ